MVKLRLLFHREYIVGGVGGTTVLSFMPCGWKSSHRCCTLFHAHPYLLNIKHKLHTSTEQVHCLKLRKKTLNKVVLKIPISSQNVQIFMERSGNMSGQVYR